MSEEQVVNIIEDVISDLNNQLDLYENDKNKTIEEKAIDISEIRTALLLLRAVKKVGLNSTKRIRINTCFYNRQLINSAKQIIKVNEDLLTQYKDLSQVCYYTIPDLE